MKCRGPRRVEEGSKEVSPAQFAPSKYNRRLGCRVSGGDKFYEGSNTVISIVTLPSHT